MKWDSVVELCHHGADWAADHRGKLVLELGPGTGDFALTLSRQFPRNFHILVDMNVENANAIISAIKLAQLRNIGIICGLADKTLASVPGEIKFDDVYCLFPSPYNTKSKIVPRLFGRRTCSEIARVTERGSHFTTASDKSGVISAFELNLAQFFERTRWKLPIEPLQTGTAIGTRMERKFCVRKNIRPNLARYLKTS